MINAIIQAIRQIPEISAYKIVETTTLTSELFYVLTDLETSRATDTTNYQVTIYVDFDHYRGSTTIQIYPYFQEDEILEALQDGAKLASNVKNEYFPLPDKAAFAAPKALDIDFKEASNVIVKSIFAANHYQQGWINSTEIFLTKKYIRFVNSNGIDYKYDTFQYFVEVIPTWEGEKEEVELYRSFTSNVIDSSQITKEVEETLENAKNRSEATALENKDIPVIFQKDEAKRIFWTFANELDYSLYHSNTQQYKVGDKMQDTDTGDKMTITLEPVIEGSIQSSPIDEDGIVLHPQRIIEDGIAKKRWGTQRYGYYLHETPTGKIQNISVEPGTKTFADLSKEPVLLCVSMSGLQIDRYSGYIGGEVRLGYYYDGSSFTPVTGLSISGSLNECKNHFEFSKEIYQSSSYKGPMYIKTKGLKIN